MRVADCGRVKDIRLPFQLYFFRQNFTLRAFNRNVLAMKTNFAHFHGHRRALIDYPAGYDAPRCVYGKRLFRYPTAIPEVAGKNPQAVAAFFRFAAVGVEYAQPEVGLLTRFGTVKDSVCAETEMAMADEPNIIDFGPFGRILRVEDQIIIAQRVVFGKFSHCSNKSVF